MRDIVLYPVGRRPASSLQDRWINQLRGTIMKNRLRILRKKSGLSVPDIADEIGLTGPAYRRWERGEVDPKVSQALQICALFDCKMDEIWGEDRDVPDHIDIRYSVKPGQTVHFILDCLPENVDESTWKKTISH